VVVFALCLEYSRIGPTCYRSTIADGPNKVVGMAIADTALEATALVK